MVRIEITKSKVYDQKGNQIPVGTVLELAAEPMQWANKYRVVASSDGKVMTAGGKRGPKPKQPAPEPEPAPADDPAPAMVFGAASTDPDNEF